VGKKKGPSGSSFRPLHGERRVQDTKEEGKLARWKMVVGTPLRTRNEEEAGARGGGGRGEVGRTSIQAAPLAKKTGPPNHHGKLLKGGVEGRAKLRKGCYRGEGEGGGSESMHDERKQGTSHPSAAGKEGKGLSTGKRIQNPETRWLSLQVQLTLKKKPCQCDVVLKKKTGVW